MIQSVSNVQLTEQNTTKLITVIHTMCACPQALNIWHIRVLMHTTIKHIHINYISFWISSTTFLTFELCLLCLASTDICTARQIHMVYIIHSSIVKQSICLHMPFAVPLAVIHDSTSAATVIKMYIKTSELLINVACNKIVHGSANTTVKILI